jgi:hypothetical protein
MSNSKHGLIPDRGKKFIPSPKMSRTALGLAQSFIQGLPGMFP